MNILFLDSVHPLLWSGLTADGHTCIDGTAWSREEALVRLTGIHGVVIRSRITLDCQFLDAASDLLFIARSGAGMENIDTDHANGKNIRCLHAPEGNRDAVAEHAMGMLLMLQNKLSRADREVRQGSWNREPNRGIELKEKTVGLIGYGNMGRAFAQRLSGFGCRVIAYDKYLNEWPDSNAERVAMDIIVAQTDVLSLHVPLTEETRYMVDREFLSQFKKPIILVNTARGSCVSIKDLTDALKDGKVSGACLDVLEYEDASFEKFAIKNSYFDQLPEWQYLIHSDQVVFSPHIAGWTVESYRKLSEVLLDKIRVNFPAD